MDTDEVMRQFDLLENKIGYLIEQCSTLEQENLELKQKVEELGASVQEKTEAEQQYSKQKALIRSKIDHLLEKLNQVPIDAPIDASGDPTSE